MNCDQYQLRPKLRRKHVGTDNKNLYKRNRIYSSV